MHGSKFEGLNLIILTHLDLLEYIHVPRNIMEMLKMIKALR